MFKNHHRFICIQTRELFKYKTFSPFISRNTANRDLKIQNRLPFIRGEGGDENFHEFIMADAGYQRGAAV